MKAKIWKPEFESFAKRHRLTLQETRLLLARVSGEPNKVAADMLGCTNSSIATYWQRIRRKTSCNDQAEVIAKLFREKG